MTNKPTEIQKTLRDKSIPSFYFNAFTIASSDNDILIITNKNGANEAVFNISHETAKRFSEALTQTLLEVPNKTLK